ncbi:MAG: GNAT family N-acetyltransferase [Alphaproteobacteria bacterium]|nr:GNAT family N-acetyltransferase [Alphaproteobacteria bacterium]
MFTLSIRTDRLLLRPFTLTDAKRVQQLAGDNDVARWLGSVPHPYPDGYAESWIATHDALRAEGRAYPFAVTWHGILIGSAGVDRRTDGDLELGYWLGKEFWGHRLMSEAARAIVDLAFGWLGAPKVVAGFMDGNAASSRILAGLGFAGTGIESRDSKARCGQVSCNMLVLTRDAWAAKRV